MRISDWRSDVCSSDLQAFLQQGSALKSDDESKNFSLVKGAHGMFLILLPNSWPLTNRSVRLSQRLGSINHSRKMGENHTGSFVKSKSGGWESGSRLIAWFALRIQ